jgi:hypothetical protein
MSRRASVPPGIPLRPEDRRRLYLAGNDVARRVLWAPLRQELLEAVADLEDAHDYLEALIQCLKYRNRRERHAPRQPHLRVHPRF